MDKEYGARISLRIAYTVHSIRHCVFCNHEPLVSPLSARIPSFTYIRLICFIDSEAIFASNDVDPLWGKSSRAKQKVAFCMEYILVRTNGRVSLTKTRLWPVAPRDPPLPGSVNLIKWYACHNGCYITRASFKREIAQIRHKSFNTRILLIIDEPSGIGMKPVIKLYANKYRKSP